MITQNMLKANMSLEQIASLTGLTIKPTFRRFAIFRNALLSVV
jgi:hypothetical protein